MSIKWSHRIKGKVISTKVSVDQYRKFKLLTEYLYQKELAYFHTPSAVLRNQIEDLLRHYCSEVDYSTDSSKDLNNTSRHDTSVLSPSLIEEGQENQEEVTQHIQSESEEWKLAISRSRIWIMWLNRPDQSF